MLPVREPDSAERHYHEALAIVRQRIVGYVRRRLVPHQAGFDDAEDIAQSCAMVLMEQYPEKRELGEMTAIAVGIARNKIAQFRRDRERMPSLPRRIFLKTRKGYSSRRPPASRWTGC